jgi:hypothetical protein
MELHVCLSEFTISYTRFYVLALDDADKYLTMPNQTGSSEVHIKQDFNTWEV